MGLALQPVSVQVAEVALQPVSVEVAEVVAAVVKVQLQYDADCTLALTSSTVACCLRGCLSDDASLESRCCCGGCLQLQLVQLQLLVSDARCVVCRLRLIVYPC